ncbi:MAG: threonine-phosphate decarboxylase [Nitratireductor sp.]|nr:threonine-phosphate decarboxylase [Nitratireductor sp.]
MKTPYHGGALDAAIAEFGGERCDWLDLSTGINPHAYPITPASADSLHRLPDQGQLNRLLAVARKAFAVSEGFEIVAAPGTQALIELLPRLLPGREATIIAPHSGTYREHAHCCIKAGRDVEEVLSPDDVEARGQLAILVRPNNPDGSIAARENVLALSQRLESSGGMLIVDEAFCDCTPRASLAGEHVTGLVILKSFGKFFGLAGLRLGFALCPPDLAAQIADRFGPWAISGPGIEAGIAAYGDGAWIAAMRARLADESQAVAAILENAGLEIAGRNGLFVLARHHQSEGIFRELAGRHILVRPFPDRPGLLRFGLPGSDFDRRRLKQALHEIGQHLP